MMEQFFRKHGHLVLMGAVAILALLLAMMVNSYVASKLAPYTVPRLPKLEAKKPDGPARTTTRRDTADRVGLLEKRCLFGCEEAKPDDGKKTCPEKCPDGQSCVEGVCAPTPPAVDPALLGDIPQRSDLNIKLHGVMVARPMRFSTAVLLDPSQQQSEILRPGDPFAGGAATLLEIRRDRIIFERNGRKEYITLEGTIAGDPGQPSPLERAALLAPKKTTSPALNATGPRPTPLTQKLPPPSTAITKVSADSFVMPRAALDAALGDKQKLMEGVKIVPGYVNGKRNGLKLMAVDPGSSFQSLGLTSGDVVQTINGQTVTSQLQALELLERARKDGKLSVTIDRQGTRKQLSYQIK